MDVTDEFKKVRIFFTDDGFVAVLEEMAVAFMAFIEGHGIAGHKPAHDLAKRGRAGSEQEMKMVWDQGPCVTLGLGFFQGISQTIKEGFTVLVVSEDFGSVDATGPSEMRPSETEKPTRFHGVNFDVLWSRLNRKERFNGVKISPGRHDLLQESGGVKSWLARHGNGLYGLWVKGYWLYGMAMIQDQDFLEDRSDSFSSFPL